MSINAKKSMGSTLTLVLLGLIALFAGPKWLAVLIPVAMLVWYGVGATLKSSRN